MIVKLLTKHHLECLSLNEAAEARPSLHMSRWPHVGNLMSRLISYLHLPNLCIIRKTTRGHARLLHAFTVLIKITVRSSTVRYSFCRTCVYLLKLTNRNYKQFLPLYLPLKCSCRRLVDIRAFRLLPKKSYQGA